MDPVLKARIALLIVGAIPVIAMTVLFFMLDKQLWPDIQAWFVRAWAWFTEVPEGYELYPEFNGIWKLGIRKKKER